MKKVERLDSKHCAKEIPHPRHKEELRPRRLAIKLSKNFGHQKALLAGLHYAKDHCDCAISMDCDLQQDSDLIPAFIERFKQGKDIVLGVRTDRQGDGIFKRYSALGFYKIMSLLGVKIVKNHADFRLLSSRALAYLSDYNEVHFFLRAIVLELGLSVSILHFHVKPRAAGQSKYSLSKMITLAWDGITSFSIRPLRLVSALGGGIFCLALFFGIYALYVRFFTDEAVSGWASILILLCLFSGLQLLSLGIIGEYIGRIYQEVKRRPRYHIEEILD